MGSVYLQISGIIYTIQGLDSATNYEVQVCLANATNDCGGCLKCFATSMRTGELLENRLYDNRYRYRGYRFTQRPQECYGDVIRSPYDNSRLGNPGIYWRGHRGLHSFLRNESVEFDKRHT